MKLPQGEDPQFIFDKHFTINCPHCQKPSNVSAISIPRWKYLNRFRPEKVGIGYRCDSCNAPVFLRFDVQAYPSSDAKVKDIEIAEVFEEVELCQETFEFNYLPEEVASDFREALTCYSNMCHNAFAAMCRRCIQSACNELGAEGKTKVQNQIKELKEMGVIDDEIFEQLKQIMLSGHDGAHPHLPKLNSQRASVLLQLMKDVLHQLFVRQAKIKEAIQLRTQARTETKDG